MLYIKKLVILTGGGARATLILENNGFGAKCKLNIFDLKQNGDYRFVLISGDNMFVMKIAATDRCVDFEPGEVDPEEIHAAIIGDDVVMYGSNCAKKLIKSEIINRVKRKEEKIKKDSFITFSGRNKNVDYFKNISPPGYDDFAIAEKNYYPAYVSLINAEAASTLNDDLYGEKTRKSPESAKRSEAKKTDRDKSGASERKRPARESVENAKPEVAAKNKKVANSKKEDRAVNDKIMPHDLEQKYLRLMGMAATAEIGDNVGIAAAKGPSRTEAEEETTIDVSVEENNEQKQAEQKVTACEKPEVIAMARRVTLRDYRVEEPQKASGRKATFFERSSAQIEKLMSSFERFTPVERMIPGSRFVKINYDKKRYYIVGVIGRDYICYGVPSVYSATPPELFNGYARWLPFDASKPHGEGFWIMYQDGVSGKTLKS